jgi:hypothetical protein
MENLANLPAMAAAAAITAVLLLWCRCTALGVLRVVDNISAGQNTSELILHEQQTSPVPVQGLLHDQGFSTVVTCSKTQQTELRHSYVQISSVEMLLMCG